MHKKDFSVIATSYGRNKNLDDETKKQKANNSLSHRFAAINKTRKIGKNQPKQETK